MRKTKLTGIDSFRKRILNEETTGKLMVLLMQLKENVQDEVTPH